ncbi:MAG: leucyl aminopeptidase [Oleiphilaceae bacterium]|nr:leucyl aminopeptidase [Oleiphilaceae bacterium]
MMTFSLSTKTLIDIKSACVCLPFFSDTKLNTNGKALDEKLDGQISKKIKQYQFKGQPGELCEIAIAGDNPERIILIGCGEFNAFDTEKSNKSMQALAKSLVAQPFTKAAFELDDLGETLRETALRQLMQGINDVQYSFDAYKSKKSEAPRLREISVFGDKSTHKELKKLITYTEALCKGINTTKDLGNQPGNVCTPTYLAETAKALAKDNSAISVKILEEKDMEKLNMGAFLSVAKGSTEPGKMIIIEYKGGNKKDAPHVLVGKGITFDTGGISLKPGPQMDEMKYDMCGAASVLGVMTAINELRPKMNVVGVIAAAENMPAGNASKPGDIVTTSSGQTVEILNTDAEGRLVLCDALTYVERFKPASVVDIATLTGACIIALGHCTSAVMSNNQELADALLAAGQQAQDKAWQLPLWDEYQTQLDSPFADMQNIGGKGAGSITAGCFLARFTKAYKWAHLDIAGTAWVSGGKDKGATGRPVPLLMQYLMNQLNA